MNIRIFAPNATLATALCALLAVANVANAKTRIGPFGGGGGGDFRTVCEPGEYMVGFDAQTTHVVDRIAPVCGRDGGTYGRPWAGGDNGRVKSLRCPGAGVVTILQVFVDAGPLISDVGMSCWNPISGETADKVLRTRGVSINSQRMICDDGQVAVGIFGRAGTAIDSLGLICDTWHP
jgi:hypothetical protein